MGYGNVKMLAHLYQYHITPDQTIAKHLISCSLQCEKSEYLVFQHLQQIINLTFLLYIRHSSRKVKDKDEESQPIAYVASTIRNSETYERFLNALGECKTNVKACV